jgi:serine/threonine-protein kinase
MTTSLDDRVIAACGHHYELDGEIGRGGMAVVYRARDRRLNRPVAIKVLPPELAFDQAIRTRFTREAQTSALLSHAHIVPIYDVGEQDGIAYIVMGLITGGNLATLLTREPRQPIDEVRRLLCEVADALDYAHVRGVIHRDIKPDNILLDRDGGRAVVTDFGIARAMEAGTRLTVTGIAVGTPTYMSPEQAAGEREIDGRSDLYSLGVLGYQMLTGRVPFVAGNQMALLLKHMSEQPRPIAELRPEAPKGLCEAIERALMKAPEDRWPNAAAMRDALISGEARGGSWRAEHRDMVRYPSPRPVSPRRGTPAAEKSPNRPAAVVTPNGIVLEPEHLVSLTPAQRDDLRLWHGRVNLMDRIVTMRRYALVTGVTAIASMGLFALGVDSGMPPFVLAPIIPAYMGVKLWRRGRSLRESGLRLRRVLFSLRARWVLPTPPPRPTERQLEKLAPREVLDSPHGAAIRRAVEEKGAILAIVAKLSKADRALMPELAPTVNSLVERIVDLARTLHRLDQSIDPRQAGELDARIAELEPESATPEGERRLGLLRRQRSSVEDLVQRRAALARQLDSAGLALGNLRYDLIKIGSSGIASVLSDVSSATQQARALSREIDTVLEAVAEVKGL